MIIQLIVLIQAVLQIAIAVLLLEIALDGQQIQHAYPIVVSGLLTNGDLGAILKGGNAGNIMLITLYVMVRQTVYGVMGLVLAGVKKIIL